MTDTAKLGDLPTRELSANPKFTVSAARRILAREGCESLVAGHVSLRGDDGATIWTSPFEYFDETTPESVVQVDFDLQPVHEGGLPVSPALEFHGAIYRARPDVQSIIHIHSHWLSVFATTSREIGMYNVGSVVFFGEQTFFSDDGTRPPVEGYRVAATLGDRSVVIIKNHGAIVVADSIEKATVLSIMLERAARYHIEAEAIGGIELPEAEVLRGKASYHRYFVPQMWNANLRRLRKSDPEIFATPECETITFAGRDRRDTLAGGRSGSRMDVGS